MKQLLTITIVLYSIGAIAQTKSDSSVFSPPPNGKGILVVDSINSSGLKYENYNFKSYKIDWRKVKTFAQMKMIMEFFNFTIMGQPKGFNKIKKFLIQQ